MRPILIGAGRGSRLQGETDEVPKTLVSVMGRPMLEWILDAFKEAGFSRRDIVFVCGYKAEVLRAKYPEFSYVMNSEWEKNNILASLMVARDYLSDGFVCSYTDIVYRSSVLQAVVDSLCSSVLACDTDWRRRYRDRTQHPESDGEKVRVEGGRIVEVSRQIEPARAHSEFTGVAKFSREGARELIAAFDKAHERHPQGEYREGRSFKRAYLIDLFQEMIESGSEFFAATTHGGTMEIDTLEDLACAERWWNP